MTEQRQEEIIAELIEALVTDRITEDDVPWERFSVSFHDQIMLLVRYERGRRARYTKGPQRRALSLLRSFLTTEQQRSMRNRRYFYVQGSAGGTYRIFPYWGTTQRVERHGKNWYAVSRFCLHQVVHSDDDEMPAADLALAHMLWLRADEELFLSTANATPVNTQLWDGEYLRQLNHRRRDPAEAAMRRMLEESNGEAA